MFSKICENVIKKPITDFKHELRDSTAAAVDCTSWRGLLYDTLHSKAFDTVHRGMVLTK